MATTSSPTATSADRPRVTVGSPDAPSMRNNARSAPGSLPTSVAERGVASDVSLITTDAAPSTTCALVRTSPVAVRITPVPAPARPPPKSTWIDTTAGATAATTSATVLPNPLKTLGGVVGGVGVGRSRDPPPTAPPLPPAPFPTDGNGRAAASSRPLSRPPMARVRTEPVIPPPMATATNMAAVRRLHPRPIGGGGGAATARAGTGAAHPSDSSPTGGSPSSMCSKRGNSGRCGNGVHHAAGPSA